MGERRHTLSEEELCNLIGAGVSAKVKKEKEAKELLKHNDVLFSHVLVRSK